MQDHEINEAIDYLKGHLEGEVGLWKESDVKDKLKDWRMSQQKPVNPIVGDDPFGGQGGYVSNSPQKPTADVAKMRADLKEKVKFMPSTEAKDLLNDIIENEDSYILDRLLRYVQ